MIEYRKGDLFSVKSGILLHSANSMGVMGSGVAKTFKELYPKAFEQYEKDVKVYGIGVGKNSIFSPHDNFVLVSAIGQSNFGRDSSKRYVSYDAICECLDSVVESNYIARLEDKTINMPKIGAGLGGGSWSIIEAIINDRTKHNNVVVWEI